MAADSKRFTGGVGEANPSSKPLHQLITEDIAKLQDFALGVGKNVIGIAGMPGDINSAIERGLESMLDITVPDGGLPDSSDIEKALGIYSENPSSAETAGNIAGSFTNPESAMLIGIRGLKSMLKAGVDLDEVTTGIRHLTKAKAGNGGKAADLAEISDKPSIYMHPENPRALVSRPLGGIFLHSNLYKAYPELKQLPVSYINDPSSSTRASIGIAADGQAVRMKLNTAHLKTPEDMKKSILHEVQHAVQGLEGIDSGTSIAAEAVKLGYPENLASLFDKARNNLKANPDDLAANKEFLELHGQLSKAERNYWQNQGEQHARVTALRKYLKLDERRKYSPQAMIELDDGNRTVEEMMKILTEQGKP